MVARPWGWDTAFMIDAFRLARRDLRSWSRRPSTSCCSDASCGDGARGRGPRRRAARRRGRRAAPAAGPGAGSSSSTSSSWPGRSSTRTTRRCSSAASCSSSASRRRPAPYQGRIELRTPLLVGFFLAGLVIHGGLQGWWIAPVLAQPHRDAAVLGATILTAFNDNALITYLATLVPNLSESAQDRRRRGRGHRRRPDRDRERAEPGRPGAARAASSTDRCHHWA